MSDIEFEQKYVDLYRKYEHAETRIRELEDERDKLVEAARRVVQGDWNYQEIQAILNNGMPEGWHPADPLAKRCRELEAKASGWEAEALLYHKNAEYHREKRESAEARIRELEAEVARLTSQCLNLAADKSPEFALMVCRDLAEKARRIEQLEAALGQHTNVPLINENARLKAKADLLEDEVHILKTEQAVREADRGSDAARRNEAKQVTIDQYFEAGRRAGAEAAEARIRELEATEARLRDALERIAEGDDNDDVDVARAALEAK